MSQPTPYVITTNFTEYASAHSGAPYNPAAIDVEYQNISESISDILTNLVLIQQDDGALRASIVTLDALSTDVIIFMSGNTSAWILRGAWITARAYSVYDVVTNNGSTYVCNTAHTSGTFGTDLAAVKWIAIAIEGDGSAVRWASQITGIVDGTDYSAKAYAVGGVGTETNNAKYYATAAGASAAAANISQTAASASATAASAAAVAAVSGTQTIYIPAGAMNPSVSVGCASLNYVASGANQPDIVSLDFNTTTQQYAQFSVAFPKSWNEGTVTAKFFWSHAATTTNFGVVWNLQGVAVSDDDTIAVAYGTAQQVADAGGTTNDQYVTSATAAITIAGTPAIGDMVNFRVSRVTGDGSDTLAIDARLMGIQLFWQNNAGNDD